MERAPEQENIEYFDFKCEECDSKNIGFRSLKHSYKPLTTDNKDLMEGLPKEATRLNNLPTLRDSILKSDKEDLIMFCKDCGITSRIDKPILKRDLRKWLKAIYPTTILL